MDEQLEPRLSRPENAKPAVKFTANRLRGLQPIEAGLCNCIVHIFLHTAQIGEHYVRRLYAICYV